MTNTFARGMSRATELTQSGRLDEATALIRALVQGQPAPSDPSAGARQAHGALPHLDAPAAAGLRPRRASMRWVGKGLGETLRGIAAGGMPRPGTLAPAPIDIPHGAQFLSLTHRGAQGGRDYRLYVPANRALAPMPLIVMLHGCTQTPEDFAAGTGMNALAEEVGCLVAWPAQPRGANAQRCWNWFRPEDQARDRGEPALIAGIVRDVLRDHPADPARVYVAGLSAGGAAAAVLCAAYPEVFAAVGVHSGLPVGGAQDVPSALAAMRSGTRGGGQALAVPAIVFHGLADATVHPGNGRAVVAQALRPRSDLSPIAVTGTSRGGRSYRQTRHEDASGRSIAEHWEIEGAGHAWAGGDAGGSHTDPHGPDASREMMRFFLQHARTRH
ncbi:alpha/beta hydrolase family esterase [Rhodobaculum claviforme]|uniref:Esterase, PHB depolymerase family n=1 Tax=Rhodobaculum claviforme TaxID=1549854 RepID=A0A934TLP2_9RHOB|nr:PHB depolymerase family esterase [Rhodobaculum claviforme]MBK5927447.1 hypothetical protein [Rhodobaculum claviforme]